MALKLENASIIYPVSLIPESGAFTLMFRQNISAILGYSTSYLWFTNTDHTKILTIGWYYVASDRSLYEVNYSTSDGYKASLTMSSLPTTRYQAIVEYNPGELKLWDFAGNFKTVELTKDFSDLNETHIACNSGLAYPEDLTIWEGGWDIASSLQSQTIPPTMIKSRFKEIIFYEKFWNTYNNPYRTINLHPIYTHVDLGPTVVGGTQLHPTVCCYNFANNRYAPPAPPNEYIIDITTEMEFVSTDPEKKTECKDTITFRNVLGQSLRYLVTSNTLSFIGDITSATKVKNIHHTLFMIEDWLKENDLQIASDTFSNRLLLIESIERVIVLTKIISNSITIRNTMNGYKRSTAENFGE